MLRQWAHNISFVTDVNKLFYSILFPPSLGGDNQTTRPVNCKTISTPDNAMLHFQNKEKVLHYRLGRASPSERELQENSVEL